MEKCPGETHPRPCVRFRKLTPQPTRWWTTLEFTPVRDDISKLAASIALVGANSVPATAFSDFKATYENNRITSRQDNGNRFAAIEAKFANQVPRGEHERVWASYDRRFTDIQRQVDEVKQAQGGIYGARDVLMDLKSNHQRLERELSDIEGGKGRDGGRQSFLMQIWRTSFSPHI